MVPSHCKVVKTEMLRDHYNRNDVVVSSDLAGNTIVLTALSPMTSHETDEQMYLGRNEYFTSK